jgi:NAD-dependent dihydropyrimidine dehydrogenase PreA subunit
LVIFLEVPYIYYISTEDFMAYQIEDGCINCGACESECPVGAISEKDNARWIDPDQCASCGVCVSACSVEAIKEA